MSVTRPVQTGTIKKNIHPACTPLESGKIEMLYFDRRGVDGRYRPIFFWYDSISTVDFDRFLGEIDGQSNIDRIFKYVNLYRPSISTVFSSRRILIDRRYRPYSQVGESLSTVDIDRDQSTGRLKSNRPIDDSCAKYTPFRGAALPT